MKRFSILHISDLHKIEGTNYRALLESLLTDKDSYLNSGIIEPKYVVVSGDLIHGGNSEAEIRQQYAETKTFLDEVVCKFLDGDKNKMLIVPGNHDISYPHSRGSMMPEPEENKLLNSQSLKKCHPQIRWSWEDFTFYKISDAEQYKQRFDLFKEFYNEFYAGLRTYPEDSTSIAELYTFEDDKVSFALFNSCMQLDHLNDTAGIDEDAIVNVLPMLRSNYNRGFLNIAVWHHHFYDTPRKTDYMDREIVNKMSHSYIQIGLFGHQHISQIAEFYGGDLALGDTPENQRLLLISSGTLFGGEKELPEGSRRQYNVIEIEKENGIAKVKIHVREDNNRSVSSKYPIWQPKFVGPKSCIETSVKYRQMDEKDELMDILRNARKEGDYVSAYKKLIDNPASGELYMNIRSEVIRNIKDNQFLLENLVPITDRDFMILMSCAEKEGDVAAKSRLKNNEKLKAMLNDPILKEMYDRL